MLRGRSRARPARHPPRDDVRPDRHRLADAERVRGDPPPRDEAARLLLRRRGAVHAERATADTTSTRRSSSAPSTCRTARCACRSARRSCATPTRYGEVGETHGKAAGVLGAIGAIARDRRGRGHAATPMRPPTSAPSPTTPTIAALLASRNARLADFWLNPQGDDASGPFAGRTALVVDAEDRFTTMLAHQLRHLGLDAHDRAVERGDRCGSRCRRPGRRRAPDPVTPATPDEPAHRAHARGRRARASTAVARCWPCA